MIKFESITIRNFLSFGNVPTTVQLHVPGTTLIIGRSGVGKTVLINALVYAIYDKPISDITKDNLVNDVNKKNMEVTVTFTKGDKQYTIKRFRKKKVGAAGNYVQLFENDKDITPDSSHNTNALIENIVGIQYELFVRIVAFPATLTSFLKLPLRSHYAANQTDIIEELFNLKILSEKATTLKEKIKDTEAELKTQVLHAEQVEKEIERHKTQVSNAEQRVITWEMEKEAEISDIQSTLEKVQKVDVSEQQTLHERLDIIKQQLRDALEEQRKAEKVIEKQSKIIKIKTPELEHLKDDKCPYCEQPFVDTGTKIHECEDLIQQSKKKLETGEPRLSKANDAVDLLTHEHNQIQEKITVPNIKELIDIQNKSDQYIQRLKYLQKAKNPHIEPLDELMDFEVEPPDQKQINLLRETIDHQKFLLRLLTKRDSFVRKTLLNKNIPFLNQRLSHYLVELELQHKVKFTHEMTAQISQFGKLLDFGNLSNGQQARVNIALSFAFRDVLENLHEHTNVCLLDEILDVGLDAVGIKAAARMLKHKARDESISLFIISHRDELDSAFDRKLHVHMTDSFSSLQYED